MSDLFDQKALADSGDGDYGLSGDMKKTQYVLQLLGAPYCPETLKCLLVAGEQGMEMNTGALEKSDFDSAALNAVTEFGMLPALKENDYFTSGTKAITEYINARGLGNSLIPKSATLAAEQEFWIDKSRGQTGNAVSALVDECIVSGSNDAGKIDAARQTLAPVLDELNTQLGKNKYIVGKNYSLADVHWTAVIHLLGLTAGADLIDARPNIRNWLTAIRNKKSSCGQALKAVSLLPSVEDIKANKLSNVVIDDF